MKELINKILDRANVLFWAVFLFIIFFLFFYEVFQLSGSTKGITPVPIGILSLALAAFACYFNFRKKAAPGAACPHCGNPYDSGKGKWCPYCREMKCVRETCEERVEVRYVAHYIDGGGEKCQVQLLECPGCKSYFLRQVEDWLDFTAGTGRVIFRWFPLTEREFKAAEEKLKNDPSVCKAEEEILKEKKPLFTATRFDQWEIV